jgi:hypothetical protein
MAQAQSCPSCGRTGTGSRCYGVQLPIPLANAFDEWRDAHGLNANRAIKQLIANVLAERSPEKAAT